MQCFLSDVWDGFYAAQTLNELLGYQSTQRKYWFVLLDPINIKLLHAYRTISCQQLYINLIASVPYRLTLSVRGPSYLGLTRSISWLLMPWLLTSPGHQQPWYWLYRICLSISYLRKCFKNLCQINVEEWHEMQIYVYIPSEKFNT